MRLQKAMARAGVASRRASEELIREGRVRVNGRQVTEMGWQVDPEHDEIVVDGRVIHIAPERQYVKLHKPAGVLSVVHDDRGRPDLASLMPGARGVHPVGRLDLDSEGLVLLTDHGELTHRLTHPRHRHTKEYAVLVRGIPTDRTLRRLREGVDLEDGVTAPAEVVPERGGRWGKAPSGSSWLRFVLREGRKRQVRRMCEAVGHPVRRLIRTRIASLELGDLPAGGYRPLTRGEVERLLEEADLAP